MVSQAALEDVSRCRRDYFLWKDIPFPDGSEVKRLLDVSFGCVWNVEGLNCLGLSLCKISL